MPRDTGRSKVVRSQLRLIYQNSMPWATEAVVSFGPIPAQDATFEASGHRLGMSDLKPTTISIVHPSELQGATLQTSGSTRLGAIPGEARIESGLWAGTFLVEPGAWTGIHHHGAQETVVYVLEGEAVVRWGEKGESSATVRAGDFLHVPAWLIHREENPSEETAFRWIVVRSTSEPIVVNLPENTWG